MITLPPNSLVYVAGPYTPLNAKTNHDYCRFTQRNVDRAVDVGIQLMDMGFVVYIPHLSHYIQLRMKDDFGDGWYDFDSVILRRCDGVLMMNDWEKSRGATYELGVMKTLGKPVYYEHELNRSLKVIGGLNLHELDYISEQDYISRM